ncbi:MAG: DUF3141 domain-containing protein [Thermaurantiacus tibetensis]|uniref:DUF3141 domain-containing protein n=1 Tax=Thermaurantiacus tibetensis TaxID=2759035 RepID=UPI0038B65997
MRSGWSHPAPSPRPPGKRVHARGLSRAAAHPAGGVRPADLPRELFRHVEGDRRACRPRASSRPRNGGAPTSSSPARRCAGSSRSCRLARYDARLPRGRQPDLKAIRAPSIVFASRGDNITRPQQARNWIPETHADEREIKVCGRRIICRSTTRSATPASSSPPRPRRASTASSPRSLA